MGAVPDLPDCSNAVTTETVPTHKRERANARAPTLDTIDATLDGLCACGCGASLESSPSAWYATAACQSRHQSRHATDPGAVYRRRDAAMVWASEEGDPGEEPGPDAAPVPLSEPRPVLDFVERCGHTLSPWHREVLASLYAVVDDSSLWLLSHFLDPAEAADRLVSGEGSPRGILAALADEPPALP